MIKKTFLIIFMLIMIVSIYPAQSYALSDIITGADNFLEQNKAELVNETALRKISSDLYNIFLAAGMIIAVIVGAILGIKFMTGSVEAQAKIKESLVPFVAGCVVLFGAFGIWKVVVIIGTRLGS